MKLDLVIISRRCANAISDFEGLFLLAGSPRMLLYCFIMYLTGMTLILPVKREFKYLSLGEG